MTMQVSVTFLCEGYLYTVYFDLMYRPISTHSSLQSVF